MTDELVKKLSNGKHEVVIGHRGESYEEIESRIKNGFIHIKFPQTRGGTELGVRVEANFINLDQLNLDKKEGLLHIEGTTKLNYNEVKLIADIDFSTKKGVGYLEIPTKG